MTVIFQKIYDRYFSKKIMTVIFQKVYDRYFSKKNH